MFGVVREAQEVTSDAPIAFTSPWWTHKGPGMAPRLPRGHRLGLAMVAIIVTIITLGIVTFLIICMIIIIIIIITLSITNRNRHHHHHLHRQHSLHHPKYPKLHG